MSRAILVLVLILVSGSVHAAMAIDRSVITFRSDGSARQDVRVSNPDEDPIYIDVQVLDVTQPGTDSEERTVVKDPESIGLIATPRRVMVPAGGQRLVRLVNLEGHTDRERVYRVNLKPESGPVESDEMGVKVMVGYQLLVFVEPREVKVDLQARRDGDELVLHNRGNVNVRLHQGEQCPPAPTPGGSCKELEGMRLYPGNREKVELPRAAPVTFSISASGETRTRRFE